MEPDEIKLKLVLDELDIPVDLSTFNNRLSIQKICYLLQDKGISFNFQYNWYISGPYCPQLAKTYYSLNQKIEAGDNEWKNYKISDEIQKTIVTVKNNIIESKPDTIELPNWLELLASIMYLFDNEAKSKSEIRKRIAEEKQHLIKSFDVGYLTLRKAKYINTD